MGGGLIGHCVPPPQPWREIDASVGKDVIRSRSTTPSLLRLTYLALCWRYIDRCVYYRPTVMLKSWFWLYILSDSINSICRTARCTTSCTTNPQQIESQQQVHNKLHNFLYNESTPDRSSGVRHMGCTITGCAGHAVSQWTRHIACQ